MRLILLLPFVLASAFAQGQRDTAWHWEVKAGPQFVRLNDPIGPFNGPSTGRSVKGLGWFAGMAVGTPVRHGISWRTEVLFSARNTGYIYDERQHRHAQVPDKAVVEWGERHTHMRSLEVPLLLTWSRWPGIRLEAGPAVAYLLNANEHALGARSDGAGVRQFDEVMDRAGAMAAVEWAAVLGAEVEGPNGLSLGVRFWQGFTDLDAGHGASPSQGSAWQFALAYALNGRSAALR